MSQTETSTIQPSIVSRHSPSRVLIAVIVGVLGGAVWLTATTSDVTKTSEPGVKLYPDGTPFLVDQAGDWTGSEKQGLTKEEQELLPQDTEGSRRLFRNTHGDQVYCSIILAGREATSIHRPELCLPGQGWTINEHMETIPVAAAAGGTLAVMRMNGTRLAQFPDGRVGQSRSIFLYWFVGKDRITASHWQRIYWTSKDRILRNTNHRWAYILIDVPIRGDATEGGTAASEEYAMKVATSFVQGIYPTLVEK
ncbi:MAG: exosortase C-terminal domain/associated protein EpsI [Verrucomicrobiia bacterium]|jgi:EpsI family protein